MQKGPHSAATFWPNDRGVAATEFAVILPCFLLLLTGTMMVALQFINMTYLDAAVEVAAREIRTGQSQRGDATLRDIRGLICDAADGSIRKYCATHLIVHLQSAGSWGEITPVPCSKGGRMTSQSSLDAKVKTYAGGARRVVLITACYDWKMPIPVSALRLSGPDGFGLESGGSLLQSVATFRTEPYE